MNALNKFLSHILLSKLTGTGSILCESYNQDKPETHLELYKEVFDPVFSLFVLNIIEPKAAAIIAGSQYQPVRHFLVSMSTEGAMNNNTYKIVIVGDGMVGKTSILMSYIDKKFPTEYVPTVLETYAHPVTVDGNKVIVPLVAICSVLHLIPHSPSSRASTLLQNLL